MRTFKFLSYKKDFHSITTGNNLMHGFDMDKVCLLFLKRCYAMNWDFQNYYPISFLNVPIVNFSITVLRLDRILHPFGDFIIFKFSHMSCRGQADFI